VASGRRLSLDHPLHLRHVAVVFRLLLVIPTAALRRHGLITSEQQKINKNKNKNKNK
jgi:hypothetical protein